MNVGSVVVSRKPVTYGEVLVLNKIREAAAVGDADAAMTTLQMVGVLIKSRTEITDEQLANLTIQEMVEVASKIVLVLRELVNPLDGLSKFFDAPLDPSS